jgi:hypothetical protein
MAGTQYPESDPRHHTANIRGMLEDLMTHLREDVEKVTSALHGSSSSPHAKPHSRMS